MASLIDTIPLGRMATTTGVADVAEFLAGERSSFITDEEVLANGGSGNRTAPRCSLSIPPHQQRSW
ncbi:hypothetical protein [Saccharothrix sp. ST-888]|uniref:hypothetical protein n=1 Tax=Saccharothrix sp. ST-888 TaxID=1427391 RepID=UPI0012DFFDBB|nr:hypothetical protein [Saccharothrix sp. ST-888]